VPDVRVTELVKQADGLRAKRSRRAAAVDDDGRLKVGDDLAGPSRDLGEREVQRAWDVRGGKGFRGEHIEKHGAWPAKRADQLLAGNIRHGLKSSHAYYVQRRSRGTGVFASDDYPRARRRRVRRATTSPERNSMMVVETPEENRSIRRSSGQR
jgi:hypothetical protein